MAQMASPLTPAAPPSGPNGAGPASDPRAALADMVAKLEMESPAAPEPEDSPTTATNAAPETPPETTPAEPTGQDFPASEETAPGEAGETPPPDDASTVTNADLTAALADLDPEQAQEIVRLAKSGEIPRIAKLVAQLHQHDATIESQQARIEELESTAAAAPAPATPDALPPAVTKLKTVAELKQAQRTAQRSLDYIEELFEGTPYNGDPEAKQYRVGEQEFSRRELLAEKKHAVAVLRALPERTEQIQAQGRFETERTQSRAAFHEAFAWAKDPQSVQSKEIADCIKQNPWVKTFANPEWIAAQLLYGYKPLMRDLAQRQGKGKPGKPGAPTTGATGAAPRIVQPRVPLNQRGMKPAAPAAAVKSALEKAHTEGTAESFAQLLDATGI